jgi:hypothetical protein
MSCDIRSLQSKCGMRYLRTSLWGDEMDWRSSAGRPICRTLWFMVGIILAAAFMSGCATRASSVTGRPSTLGSASGPGPDRPAASGRQGAASGARGAAGAPGAESAGFPAPGAATRAGSSRAGGPATKAAPNSPVPGSPAVPAGAAPGCPGASAGGDPVAPPCPEPGPPSPEPTDSDITGWPTTSSGTSTSPGASDPVPPVGANPVSSTSAPASGSPS